MFLTGVPSLSGSLYSPSHQWIKRDPIRNKSLLIAAVATKKMQTSTNAFVGSSEICSCRLGHECKWRESSAVLFPFIEGCTLQTDTHADLGGSINYTSENVQQSSLARAGICKRKKKKPIYRSRLSAHAHWHTFCFFFLSYGRLALVNTDWRTPFSPCSLSASHEEAEI